MPVLEGTQGIEGPKKDAGHFEQLLPPAGLEQTVLERFQGVLPLHLAAEHGHLPVVKHLAQRPEGDEALQLAGEKALLLAMEGGRTCPWYQVGTCNYPDTCKFNHECYICKDRRHGAARCYDLQSEKAKQRLGM